MKTVYYIRHAKSDWNIGGSSDFNRDITQEGAEETEKLAKLFKLKGSEINAILSSTAKRALRTSTIFANELNVSEKNLILKDDLYLADAEQLIEEVSLLSDKYSTVILVSHNPGLTELVNSFDGPYIDNVPTSGIVKVEFQVALWAEVSIHKGEVTDLMIPKMYS